MCIELNTDVVVIGGGAAGLAAAVTAAEHGAEVVVLEKSSAPGGAGRMAMGLFAVESRAQRIRQIGLTREEAFKIFMDYTHWRVDARLVKAYIEKSSSTMDWLESMGVEFAEVATYFPGGNFTWHLIKTQTGGPGIAAGAIMIKAMANRAAQLGVKIFLKTPVKKIIKTGGIVTGIQAQNEAGDEIFVKAGAVIIATGGFGNNPEMIKKYTGYEWGRDIFSFRIPGMEGDGIRMAWDAGAASGFMNMHLIYDVPLGEKSPQLLPVYRLVAHQPGLVVNLSGKRFMNEEIMNNTTFTGNAIAHQKGRCALNIFDDNTRKYYEEHGLDYIPPHARIVRVEKIAEDFKQVIADGNTHVFLADSLEELAEKTGTSIAGLLSTVDEYNHACDLGIDDLFYKNRKYLKPVKKPPFYATRLFPSGYGSLGGIQINYRTEVLDNNGEVIPGLYAAGTDANSIYGDSYAFCLPGNTLGFAVNSGRMAGENAADFVLKNKK